MAANETGMDIGAVTSDKSVNVELPNKALVLECPKVERQRRSGEVFDTKHHKAASVRKPLNALRVLFLVLDIIQHFVETKGERKRRCL